MNVMIVVGHSGSGETVVVAPAQRLRACPWWNSATALREHGRGQDLVAAAIEAPCTAMAMNGALWRGIEPAIVVGLSLALADAGPGAQP